MADEVSRDIAVRRELTHWGRENIDAMLQTTFSNAFSYMKKMYFD